MIDLTAWPAELAPAPAFDPEPFAELADVGLCVRLVGLFAVEALAGIERIAAAIDAGDGAALTALAHALEGTAATVGAARIAALCAQLERSPAAASAAAWPAQLTAALDEALSAMDAHLAQIATAARR